MIMLSPREILNLTVYTKYPKYYARKDLLKMAS